MDLTGGGRKQWSDTRRRPKEPTLYDEWLSEEKAVSHARRKSVPVHPLRASGDTPVDSALGHSGTIRPVPADADDEDDTDSLPPTGSRSTTATPTTSASADMSEASTRDEESDVVPERGTTSFERAFIPSTTTTIVGGPAAASSSRAAKSRRSIKERAWGEREGRMASQSPPSSRNGSSVSGVLARSGSRSNHSNNNTTPHQRPQGIVGEPDAYNQATAAAARPRTRTMDERRREYSPNSLLARSRNRIGSVNSPALPPSAGAEYLASVPAATSPPQAPSITSLPSPVLSSADMLGRRSTSPVSSTADSMTSNPNSRRILHLMKTLNGRMSGHVVLRRDVHTPWMPIYAYIHDDTGSLMCEPCGGDAHRTLVSRLRACTVRHVVDGETPYLEIAFPQPDRAINLKLETRSDFESWYAALLYWQSHDQRSSHAANGPTASAAASATPARPDMAQRRPSSARGEGRDRAGSARSDRRKSVIGSLREAPVIKIGKMIYWDTNVGYSNAPGSAGEAGNLAPPAFRVQAYGSKRWRRISGQLRENGELKLHSDADNSLISVVQLSQLSRCAIQRLNSSVLEDDFCIAIYPQYTSTPTGSQPGFIRPIFLSLENRVLYEVWFVLLRAFTIPQLYGPEAPIKEAENEEDTEGENEGHPSSNVTSTADMFRMERTLNIRVIEAKMFPPPTGPHPDTGFSGGVSRGVQAKPEAHGYYAEILLDNETRGRTVVKFEGLNPLWGESFEFLDLPPVLNNASVVIKRRPPDPAQERQQHESRLVHEAYGLTSDQHGGYSNVNFDTTCGKVEVFQELEEEKEVEKWWPIVNMYNQRVGDVLLKARADEGVILMSSDYQPLGELLHRFSNGITLQVAQMLPTELKRLSDCLLDIFQVSGRVGDWLMSLVEEEIDGIQKETPISRLRFSRRIGSDAVNDPVSHNPATTDRELIVRDLNKNATLEANLLFRGNTLLTKSLDTHMRRVGREYLEETLGAKIREINDKDPDCEVDPNRVGTQEAERNWRRLLYYTGEVWRAIVGSKHRCPIELRTIFRHIRACAEDRYGDFMRSVSYSSVSGFLFLRFFCPAVLNPKLFGLLKDDVKSRARRTFTLIAKSLQTLSNMASFGTKEQWMEPMNAFLTQNRESFKGFIDDMCYVPTPLSGSNYPSSSSSSPTYPVGVVSAETHLSYTTPMTIMQRLPPTSREGFPSLPYLIDQSRAYAELVQLWLEATTSMSTPAGAAPTPKSHDELIAAIQASEGDLMAFHENCFSLHKRTQECLNRAERAERPRSTLSFTWDEVIDQLQPDVGPDGTPNEASLDALAERIASDPTIIAPDARSHSTARETSRDSDSDATDPVSDPDAIDSAAHAAAAASRPLPTSPITHPSSSHHTHHTHNNQATFTFGGTRERPGSAGMVTSLRDSLRRAQAHSRASASADKGSPAPSLSAASGVSSATVSVSSAGPADPGDSHHGHHGNTHHHGGNTHGGMHSGGHGGGGMHGGLPASTNQTTALPSYEREVRHRERREDAKARIQREVENARARGEGGLASFLSGGGSSSSTAGVVGRDGGWSGAGKERREKRVRMRTPIVSALRKKKEREREVEGKEGGGGE